MLHKTPTQYTSLRITKTTRKRIDREMRLLIEAQSKGQTDRVNVEAETINPLALGISVDSFINLLLDQREAKRIRARKSKSRKTVE